MTVDAIVRLLSVMELMSPSTLNSKDPIADFVKQTGYSLQVHDIVTEDRYNLRMHRISQTPMASDTSSQSILMLHGLLANSAQYVARPNSIAFQLVNAGYDVWLLHSRGTSYSLAAETENYNSAKYWDYSFHELGHYDIPCAIDHILNTTNNQQLHYVGQSQGGSALIVALSTRPEYNRKIASAYLLTPGVYIERSEAIDFLSVVYEAMKTFQLYRVMLRNKILEEISIAACGNKIINRFCADLILTIVGPSSNTLDLYKFSMWAIRYVGDNSSVKQILHFKQLFDSGKFQMFDYEADNMKHYGTNTPPEYNLTLIDIPVTLMSADKDALVKPKSINKLATQLKITRKNWMVPGNHLDFMFDQKIVDQIVDDILDSIRTS